MAAPVAHFLLSTLCSLDALWWVHKADAAHCALNKCAIGYNGHEGCWHLLSLSFLGIKRASTHTTTPYVAVLSVLFAGEGGGSALHAPNTTDTTNATDTAGTHILIDIPLDGRGPVQIDVGAVLSPVLTLWITLVMMYLINTIADHAAATELDAAHMAELRRPVHGTTFMGGANPR